MSLVYILRLQGPTVECSPLRSPGPTPAGACADAVSLSWVDELFYVVYSARPGIFDLGSEAGE